MKLQSLRSPGRRLGQAAASRRTLETAGRRSARLVIETLEDRWAPSATVVAASFFDSAVYEIDTSSGAVVNTLVAPNSQGTMTFPGGIAVGPDGDLYLSSQSLFNPTGNSIVKYDVQTGNLSTFIDSASLQQIATAAPLNDSLFTPAGLRFGPDGNLYVALNGGQQSTSGGAVIRFGVDSIGGQTFYNGTHAIVASGLVQPTEMTFGNTAATLNTLYVSNTGGQTGVGNIIKIDHADGASPSATVFIASGTGSLNYPAGLSWGPDGKFYAVDLAATATHKGQILRFSSNGAFEASFTNPSNTLLNQFPADAAFTADGKLLVANLGPTYPAAFGGPGTGGSIYQFNANGTLAQVLSATAFPATTVPAGGKSYQVTNFSPSQLALNLGNVAPTVSAGSDFTINANSPLSLHATGSDADGDTLTYYWDINGDGTFGDAVGADVTLTAAQLKAMGLGASNLSVSVAASDAHGHVSTSAPITVTINQVPPTLKISGLATVAEESLYKLTLSGKATAGHTISSWSINWGDGTTSTVNGNPTSTTHTFASGPNKFTVSATAIDNANTVATSNTVTVAVTHVAPKLTISGATSVVEATPYTLNLSATVKGGHAISSWTITWGDGAVQTVGGSQTSVTHIYASGPRRFNITAKATDDVGTYAAANKVVPTVTHAPNITISGAATVVEGSAYTLSLAGNEVANHAVKKWTITWGDGKVQVLAGSVTSVTHTFTARTANYTITAKATDDVSTYASNALVLNVSHQTPVLNIIGASAATKGVDYTLNLSALEPVAVHVVKSWTIAWGDGTSTVVKGNPTSVKHKYTTANTFTISAKATDDVGTYDAANTQDVTVTA